MARFQRSRGRSRRPRRPSKWHGAASAPTNTVAGGNNNFTLVSVVQANEFVKPVVIRCVGDLTLVMEGVTVGDEQVMVLGIRVRNEAGQLNPLTNLDANWMWMKTVFFRMVDTVTDQNPQIVRIHFDIPVMRKMPIDSLLHVVFENSAGGPDIRTQITARTLIREG